MNFDEEMKPYYERYDRKGFHATSRLRLAHHGAGSLQLLHCLKKPHSDAIIGCGQTFYY